MKKTILILFALCSWLRNSFGRQALLFVLCSLFFALCQAQQSITWQRMYQGPLHFDDSGWDICDAGNGNFFMLGNTPIFGYSSQIYVLKINSYGDTIWTRTIGFPGDENGIAIAPSIDRGCVVTGSNDSSFTAKLDSSGNLVWWKNYEPGGTKCWDIINTSDGGYIACGEKRGYQLYDGYIFKVNSIGNLVWSRVYPSFNKGFSGITSSLDEGYVTIGTVHDSPADTVKAVIIKIDSTGRVIWEKRYKITEETGGNSIHRHTMGYIISGSTGRRISGAAWYPYLLKTDDSGNMKYFRTYPADTPAYSTPMNVINLNRFVIGYSVDSVGTGLWNGKLMIIDSSGTLIYQKILPSAGYMGIRSVLPIPNGDIIAVGYNELDSTSIQYIYAVRTDSMLNVPPLRIEIISSHIPIKSRLFPSYPNPFNPVINIHFEISKASNITVKIYDISGRLIEVIYNDIIKPGEYRIGWDASKYSSGIYFCVLNIENKYFHSQKLILLK